MNKSGLNWEAKATPIAGGNSMMLEDYLSNTMIPVIRNNSKQQE